MLRALHRPFPPAQEAEFLEKERVRSRMLARTAGVCAFITVTLNWIINVTVFGNADGWVTVVTCAVVAAGLYWITATRTYLVTPSLDLGVATMMWLTLMIDYMEEGITGGRFRGWPHLADADTTKLFFTCVIHLFIASVYTAIVFLGNFRTYLFYTLVATAGYLTFVYFLLGFEPAVKLLFLGLLVMAISLFFNKEREGGYRDRFLAHALLDQERRKSESLLYNVLPQAVATRLKGGEVVVDSYSHLTAVFVDVVGFSVLSKQITPEALLGLLNQFFLAADHCAAAHGLEKVKTIGDAYMAVAGGVSSTDAGARETVQFGIDLVREVAVIRAEAGLSFDIRVGIHTGPAIGGVIGETRLAYDYWGDTMNIASRIEGAAPVGGVAVSAATFGEIPGAFPFEPPETIRLKGVGDTVIHPLRHV